MNIGGGTPDLFGLTHSNRDFSKQESWGKNQFNSSFPAALCCYLASRNLTANYLQFQDAQFKIGQIPIDQLFGLKPLSTATYFSFETSFSAYDQYSVGHIPRTDLVISKTGIRPEQVAALEIKLTALPDSTTCDSDEADYGSELVVRPDTMFYLAAGLAHNNKARLGRHFYADPVKLNDWTDPGEVLAAFEIIHQKMFAFLCDPDLVETPNIVQPIWKTNGKSANLAEHCLDVFAWSTAGFLYFLLQITSTVNNKTISRPMRSLIWTYKMLLDIATVGQTNYQDTIDSLSFNTKNDKAFAVSGVVTRNYMRHENLQKPRIRRDEIRSIILGGGQNMLSPERRFDAIIVSSPDLFR